MGNPETMKIRYKGRIGYGKPKRVILKACSVDEDS